MPQKRAVRDRTLRAHVANIAGNDIERLAVKLLHIYRVKYFKHAARSVGTRLFMSLCKGVVLSEQGSFMTLARSLISTE